MDMFVIFFLVILPFTGGSFIVNPEDATAYEGEIFNFNWTFGTTNLILVEWKFGIKTMLQYAPSLPPGSQYTYYDDYSSARLNHISNGEISLSSLSIADTGNYSCVILYSSGSPNTFTDVMLLRVYGAPTTVTTETLKTSSIGSTHEGKITTIKNDEMSDTLLVAIVVPSSLVVIALLLVLCILIRKHKLKTKKYKSEEHAKPHTALTNDSGKIYDHSNNMQNIEHSL